VDASTALNSKVIVVTGSTRGIGRAIAEACAAAGAAVVVSSRNELAVEEVVSELEARDFRVVGIKCDVTIPDDVERLLNESIDAFGRVDVWVNNAGLPQGVIPLDELTDAEAAEIVRVNVLGVINGSQVALRYFKDHGGILINMTGRGHNGKASPYTSVYAMTKAAVTSLTRSLAAENAEFPVSVHLLSPGMVPTDFYRDLRVGKNLTTRAAKVPLILDAIGVPPEETGKLVVEIAAQEPGRTTGGFYTPFKGARRMRGMIKMMWLGMSGKMKD
jgi:NAD(P)-dependent dehydrogenase (short-subunit alcohol dehydrogenase family)